MSLRINQTDREIFNLTWPNIISNVSVPLLSSVDTALMGGLSVQHLGAVGLGSMIFNFFYWNFGFLRMGTTGMTAQAYGAKDQAEISSVFYRALIIAGCIAFILILFKSMISHSGIYMLNADDGLKDYIFIYVVTRIWAAPATLGLYVLFGWLFGMQNARLPMYATIVINLINIVVSYILIIHFKQGVFGVALGTVIAQYVGFLLTIILVVKYYHIQLPWTGFDHVLSKTSLLKFFRINKDIFIRTLCLTLVFGFFYSRSSSYGEVLLGVNVVLLQFLNWMSYGIDGFAFAAESIIGKWFGAKDEKKMRFAIKRVFIWSGIGSIIFSLIYFYFGHLIFRIFTQEQTIIAASKDYLWWLALMPILGFASYIWDGIYIGMTASKSMRNSMLFSLLIYFLVYLTLEKSLGVHALWMAFSVFLVVRAATQHGLFIKYGMELK